MNPLTTKAARYFMPLLMALPAYGQLTWDASEKTEASLPSTSTQFSFKYTNSSAETLTITNISTSCGCTNAVASLMSIAPNETGILSCEVKPHPIGRSNRITVQDSSRTSYVLTATTKSNVKVDPQQLLWAPENNSPQIINVTLEPGLEFVSAKTFHETIRTQVVPSSDHVTSLILTPSPALTGLTALQLDLKRDGVPLPAIYIKVGRNVPTSPTSPTSQPFPASLPIEPIPPSP